MHEHHNKSDLSRKAFEQDYVYDTRDENHLLQKELILIQTEQTLLNQRIQMMKSFVNDLPSHDPQYSMILTTIKMDQIELDELATRKLLLLDQMDQIA
jgi:hypothetical protein